MPTGPSLRALTAAAVITAAVPAIALAHRASTTTKLVGNPAAGKPLFVSTCGLCHRLKDAKTAGTIGPDLDKLSLMQPMIVKGTSSDGPGAGSIREEQVFIGASNRRVMDARFVPPPPGDQLRRLYETWAEWLTNPAATAQIQLVARMALAHYQFETIHPYTDGNGRLGRLVAILQLLREGQLRAPVLSISGWLKDHATEYRDHLLNVSRTGDWAPWVSFFAQALAAEARDSHDRIMRLLDLRRQIGEAVRSALPRARLAVEIADDLIAFPILTVAASHARHGRSNEANRNAIAQLVDIGILEPYSEARYARFFWNKRVFQIIDA